VRGARPVRKCTSEARRWHRRGAAHYALSLSDDDLAFFARHSRKPGNLTVRATAPGGSLLCPPYRPIAGCIGIAVVPFPRVPGKLQVEIDRVPQQTIKANGMAPHHQAGDPRLLQRRHNIGQADFGIHKIESSQPRLPCQRMSSSSGCLANSSSDRLLAKSR